MLLASANSSIFFHIIKSCNLRIIFHLTMYLPLNESYPEIVSLNGLITCNAMI